MIASELHGKSHVAEDRLTSTCLGLLGLLPDSYLIAFLGKAVNSEGQALLIDSFDRVDDVAFWPYLPDGGEPDAIVCLRKSATSASLTLIVEAKHGAPKSGVEEIEATIANGEVSANNPAESNVLRPVDQLAKYWVAGKRQYRELVLIYLTHHRYMPQKEINDSLRAAGQGAAIYWLNWFNLYDTVANHLDSNNSLEYSEKQILKAIREYLEYQNYARFRGWPLLTMPGLEQLSKYGRVYGLAEPTASYGAPYSHLYAARARMTVIATLWPRYTGGTDDLTKAKN